MSEDKRTITVTVHEADEQPADDTWAFVETEEGWIFSEWADGARGWFVALTSFKVDAVGRWVEVDNIAEALEEVSES